MDKPNVTVISDKPNNGFYNILFIDDGMLITSECRTKDVYEGLVRGVAELLLDCADSYIKEQASKNISKKLPECLASLHQRFTDTLAHELALLASARQLEQEGMPAEVAEQFAKAMDVFPGEWFRVGPDSEEESLSAE